MELDDLVEKIRRFPKQSVEQRQTFIGALVTIHPTLNVPWGPGWTFKRARNLQSLQIPASVDDVIWPKDRPAELGRANPAGLRVLYLADRRDTALREVRVNEGWVAVAEFQIRPEQSIFICPIGEISQIIRTGRGFLSGDASNLMSDMLNACPLAASRSLVLTDAFLYEQMTGQDDYHLSSTVARAIFDKLSNVSAVAYTSRRQQGGINFAIKSDTFWDSWGLTSVRRGYAEHLALGFYRLTRITGVTGIFHSGKFEWEVTEKDEEMRIILAPQYSPVAK